MWLSCIPSIRLYWFGCFALRGGTATHTHSVRNILARGNRAPEEGWASERPSSHSPRCLPRDSPDFVVFSVSQAFPRGWPLHPRGPEPERASGEAAQNLHTPEPTPAPGSCVRADVENALTQELRIWGRVRKPRMESISRTRGFPGEVEGY